MTPARRIHHASLSVPPEAGQRTIAFYRDVIGLEPIPIPPTLGPHIIAWFRIGDGELHLMTEASPNNASTRRHICFEVDDVASARSTIEAAGQPTQEAPPIAGRPRFFCADPADNLLEISEINDARSYA
jgi:catechol 2,3-dioxygenase-like lactoylglutathione lyase family enzyme